MLSAIGHVEKNSNSSGRFHALCPGLPRGQAGHIQGYRIRHGTRTPNPGFSPTLRGDFHIVNFIHDMESDNVVAESLREFKQVGSSFATSSILQSFGIFILCFCFDVRPHWRESFRNKTIRVPGVSINPSGGRW